MGKRFIVSTIVVVMIAGLFLLNSTAKAQKRPQIAPLCIQCHKADEKSLWGNFGSVAMRAGTLQVAIGADHWVIRFNPDSVKVIGAETIGKIPAGREIRVSLAEKDGVLLAESIKVKPPIKVPEEKLVGVDEMARLVERGNFVLVDSRPIARYHEGHIPGAISIFDGEFDKHKDRLPKEKDNLIVFY